MMMTHIEQCSSVIIARGQHGTGKDITQHVPHAAVVHVQRAMSMCGVCVCVFTCPARTSIFWQALWSYYSYCLVLLYDVVRGDIATYWAGNTTLCTIFCIILCASYCVHRIVCASYCVHHVVCVIFVLHVVCFILWVMLCASYCASYCIGRGGIK